ncbi:MAG TPA: glycosyltransferase family 2 protein [Thermoanaerobaculia bacterium]|nr:glycosyltransferase family 2 protein [Thermoanaerobaculia bacterium]
MKLVIQIPALNEEATLGAALAAVPRSLPGFKQVAILVVDDGSTDRTHEIALEGADRIVRFPARRGLAAAFSVGVDEALAMGADIIVNFDADLQYDPADIPALVAPILSGRADLVIGDRRPGDLAHFSRGKRLLQRFGSWVVRQVSGLEVNDATSGFRAISRDAARRLNVFSKMTYTLETLIQAGSKGLRVESVPVAARPVERQSRLFSSHTKYVLIQGANILRVTALYKPLKIFSAAAAVFFLSGLALLGGASWGYLSGRPREGLALPISIGAVLIVVSFQSFLIALLGDLVAINRTLLEELKLREARKILRALPTNGDEIAEQERIAHGPKP